MAGILWVLMDCKGIIIGISPLCGLATNNVVWVNIVCLKLGHNTSKNIAIYDHLCWKMMTGHDFLGCPISDKQTYMKSMSQ